MSKEAEDFIKDLAGTDITGADAVAVYYMAHVWIHKARTLNEAIKVNNDADVNAFLDRPLSM